MENSNNELSNKTLLVIDDNIEIIEVLSEVLKQENYDVLTATNSKDGLDIIHSRELDLIMIDLVLKDPNKLNGMELLEYVLKRDPDQLVIMFSGHGSIEIAVDAIKKGAYDFLTKPFEPHRLLLTVKNALKSQQLAEEKQSLLEDSIDRYRLLGVSESIQGVRELIKRVAPLRKSVLIMGETGTGKELVARSIYYNSKRKSRVFHRLNCAAIPEPLIESELFGHEKGAFTGAHSAKEGAFEIAHRGTLFLDEIGDLSLNAQAKVLRILDYGEFTRLGSTNVRHVDTRIICATNKNLEELKRKKLFREDLYHRINVFRINIPPLRERQDDIVPILNHYLKTICYENNKKLKRFTDDALNVMATMPWFGNVRELINILERVVHFTDQEVIDSSIFLTLFYLHDYNGNKTLINDLREARDTFEKYFIITKLNENKWNISKTAHVIGLERTQLYRKIKKYRIKK